MKVRVWYDWAGVEDEIPQAAVELPNDVTLYCRGATFEEAKAKVIAKAKSLPPDEEIEI